MSMALIWIVTALYLGQAGVWLWQGKPDGALILLGYAIANTGLIWSMR